MAQITGGRVCYSRTVQPAQYESKKVEAELFFAVDEGEDHTAIFSRAAAEAHGKVYEMLGIKPADKPAISDKQRLASEKTGGDTGEVVTGKPTAEKPARTKKTAPPPAKAEDPASMGEPATTAPSAPGAAPAAPANPASPADIEDEFDALPAAEITDQQLSDAMSKKNAEIKDTRRLKELVGKYGVARSRELPQDKRAAFLLELNALKPAAA